MEGDKKLKREKDPKAKISFTQYGGIRDERERCSVLYGDKVENRLLVDKYSHSANKLQKLVPKIF